jgi:haloacetate dehalogenase
VLALWSGRGPLESWFADVGGPLALWRAWADHVRGGPVDAGHFFPEEQPEATAEALAGFFGAASGAGGGAVRNGLGEPHTDSPTRTAGDRS